MMTFYFVIPNTTNMQGKSVERINLYLQEQIKQALMDPLLLETGKFRVILFNDNPKMILSSDFVLCCTKVIPGIEIENSTTLDFNQLVRFLKIHLLTEKRQKHHCSKPCVIFLVNDYLFNHTKMNEIRTKLFEIHDKTFGIWIFNIEKASMEEMALRWFIKEWDYLNSASAEPKDYDDFRTEFLSDTYIRIGENKNDIQLFT
jgi:uncharacterized protein YegL